MHAASGRRLGFGALAAEAARHQARPGAGDQDARPVHADRQADWRASTRRSRSTGTAQFGIDTRLPGMLYAAVDRPARSSAAQLKRVRRDRRQGPARRHRRRPGARRRRGRRRPLSGAPRRPWPRCRSTGTMAPAPRTDSDAVPPGLPCRARRRRPSTAREVGDVERALAGAAQRRRGGLRGAASRACADGAAELHGPCGRPDRVDVWIGTQNPDAALQLAAKAGGVQAGTGLRPQLLPRRRLRPARGQ